MDKLLSVGFEKGEADFSIKSEITELSQEKMQEFRAMCMVAIGTAEVVWRGAQEIKNMPSVTNIKK